MKKFYALFLVMLAIAWLAVVPAAKAQYTVDSYTIITDQQAWSSINGNGGIEITELKPQGQYDYHKYSSDIFLPFSTQYLNSFTNKIKVTQNGSVVVSGSDLVADGAIQTQNVYGCTYIQSSFFWNN